MILPMFLRFYQGYTVSSVLDEFAITFFSLVNSMGQLVASENLNNSIVASIPHMEKTNVDRITHEWTRQSEGSGKLIQEAQLVRSIRGNK